MTRAVERNQRRKDVAFDAKKAIEAFLVVGGHFYEAVNVVPNKRNGWQVTVKLLTSKGRPAPTLPEFEGVVVIVQEYDLVKRGEDLLKDMISRDRNKLKKKKEP